MALATRHRSADDELGQRFAGVQLLRTGARFEVYEGLEHDTGRPVAIKLPTPLSPSWMYGILDYQAAILAAVGDHPNVITLYQRIELSDGRPALVLERGSGNLAEHRAEDGRLPVAHACAIGIKLAGALETVHRAGVVHCDVRPANVQLSHWGEPLLSGFDEAVRLDAGTARPTMQTHSAHTAPELLQGEPATVRTDVYGLAATVYELVAGRSAFRAYAGESPAVTIMRVLSGSAKPIVAPDVPLALSDLLTWALAGDPEQRPPSPSWLAEELRRIEGEQDWPRTPVIGA